MGNSIWFRGEGLGVPPAKPGGHLHDFGDGVYLTDREDVAGVYAGRRATAVENQRVWKVALDRQTLGRVLDLTLDARWNKFMNDTGDPHLMGKSRLEYVKMKHELYGQMFEDFLRANKIDIRSYDVVIGPEYNLGGKQLCILHKNGQPSKLSFRIRALFRPRTAIIPLVEGSGSSVTIKVGSVVPKGSLKIRVAKSIGGYAAGIGIMIVLNYLFSKIMGNMYESSIKGQIKSLEPEIEKRVANHRREILDRLEAGQAVYVVVTVTVTTYYTLDIDPEGGGWDQSIPGVELASVLIGKTKTEGPGEERTERSFGQRVEYKDYTMSVEVDVPREVVDSYRLAKQQLKWYDDTAKNVNLTKSDLELLSAERNALQKAIEQSFYQ
jgi:hypothetical protein